MKLFKYFKEIYKQYGMANLLLMSVLTTLIIIIIDYFNLFTLLYIKVKMPIIICCLVLFAIKLLSLKLHSLFKLKSVNYDLLQRDKIINQMTSTIANCNTDSKFVISLKGNWGSGKTTILNNVKNKLKEKNLIFIDDFEPWVYGNTKSLLVAFFDKIMNNINCGFRINDINIK